MPVALRLSKKFYDRFGDDIVSEFVEMLNLVDATARSDLRELNEGNFARFDAKLEQRVTQLEAKIETSVAHLKAEIKDDLAKRFSEQTRFLYLGWALQFAAILGLWFR